MVKKKTKQALTTTDLRLLIRAIYYGLEGTKFTAEEKTRLKSIRRSFMTIANNQEA